MELSNTIKHSEDSVDVKYYRKVPKAALIPQQGRAFLTYSQLLDMWTRVDVLALKITHSSLLVFVF